MGPLQPKTPCCGKPVCEGDGAPCLEWDRWTKAMVCRRCEAKLGLVAEQDDSKPAPPKPALRIRDLKPGEETWVDVRGVLLHQETNKMWVDHKFTTTHEPSRDGAYPGLCSVLVRKNQKGELVAVEGEKNNTTLVTKDQTTSNAVLPLLWQVG